MQTTPAAARLRPILLAPLYWSIAAAAAPITVDRETGFFGAGAGGSGWIVADLDGDGLSEVVADEWTFPDSERHLFAARWHPEVPRLQKIDILSLPVPTETASRSVGLRQFPAPDGSTQVVLVDESGYVEIVGGLPLERKRAYRAAGGARQGFEIADIDGDGRIELITLATDVSARIGVFDLLTGAPLRQFVVPAGSMAGVAVGQFDSDSSAEIVLGSISGLTMIDGVSGAIDGELPGVYPGAPLVHDVDVDGQPELIAGRSGTRVVLMRTNPLSEWISRPMPNGVSLGVLDLDDGGAPLLMRSNFESGRVELIPLPALGAPARSIDAAFETPVTLTDLDHDGRLEFIGVSGLSTSAPDRPAVVDFESGTTLWTDSEESGPYRALDVGNLDLDPSLEIAVAARTSEEGRGSGRLHVIDASTMQEQRRRIGMTGLSSELVDDLRVANIDGDNSPEIIWSGYVFGNGGSLEIVDAFTFARQAVIGAFDNRYAGFTLSAIGLANPSAGRYSSLAVATLPVASPDAMTAVVELDALTGFQTGSTASGPTQPAPSRIEALDLDDDDTVEYVFAEFLSIAVRRTPLGDAYARVPSASPVRCTSSGVASGSVVK